MIKAVLFDFGGVLTEGGRPDGPAQSIALLSGVPPDNIDIQDLHTQLIRGLMSDEAFFAELNRRYPGKTPITVETFNEASDLFVRSQPVFDLAARLRAKGITSGIFSNAYDFTAERLRADGCYQDFDPVILSYEEHMAKPDLSFFELALKRLDLPGDEVLFIDDQERFRPVAESVGMHFITAMSPGQIVHDVEQLIADQNHITL
ncbi:MAG TPA: HAD-IA family hydrolase [Bacillota bacterium]|nr:HAD-IA family hydrolase [Bacillota bacterium]